MTSTEPNFPTSFRITAENPVRDVGPDSMDYERCAALHNELLTRAIKASGHEMPPSPQTWWEKHSPLEEIVELLEPPIIEFLKRVHVVPPISSWWNFSYFLGGLVRPEDLLEGARFTNDDSGQFIKLYGPSSFRDGDDEGLLFDQENMTATFIEDYNDTGDVVLHDYAWMPLEVILDAYLQMLDEGKVEAIPRWKIEKLEQIQSEGDSLEEGSLEEELSHRRNDVVEPWIINRYTTIDVTRAVAAFERLVNAIDARIEGKAERNSVNLPWHDPATLAQAFVIPTRSFAHKFLSAISDHRVQFRYIAPGLRFPTVAEFLDQPVKAPGELSRPLLGRFPGDVPLRILQSDVEGIVDDFSHYVPPDKTAGFYIQPVINGSPHFWDNGCRLLLPFGVGRRGWARQSNGQQLGINNSDHQPKPRDVGWQLYQAGFTNGFTNNHFVQIDKVLNNWADRVERGDWEVDEQGVVGGVEMFRQADTEEHWGKYWIAPGW